MDGSHDRMLTVLGRWAVKRRREEDGIVALTMRVEVELDIEEGRLASSVDLLRIDL